MPFLCDSSHGLIAQKVSVEKPRILSFVMNVHFTKVL